MQYVSLSRFRCTQQELPLGHGARLTVQTEGCQAVDGFFQLSSPQRLHLRHKKTQHRRKSVLCLWQTATYCLILPHSDRCATTICLIGKFQGKKIGDCKPMSAIAFLLLCSFYRYGLCYSTFEVEVQSVIIPYHDYVHE